MSVSKAQNSMAQVQRFTFVKLGFHNYFVQFLEIMVIMVLENGNLKDF